MHMAHVHLGFTFTTSGWAVTREGVEGRAGSRASWRTLSAPLPALPASSVCSERRPAAALGYGLPVSGIFPFRFLP